MSRGWYWPMLYCVCVCWTIRRQTDSSRASLLFFPSKGESIVSVIAQLSPPWQSARSLGLDNIRQYGGWEHPLHQYPISTLHRAAFRDVWREALSLCITVGGCAQWSVSNGVKGELPSEALTRGEAGLLVTLGELNVEVGDQRVDVIVPLNLQAEVRCEGQVLALHSVDVHLLHRVDKTRQTPHISLDSIMCI